MSRWYPVALPSGPALVDGAGLPHRMEDLQAAIWSLQAQAHLARPMTTEAMVLQSAIARREMALARMQAAARDGATRR